MIFGIVSMQTFICPYMYYASPVDFYVTEPRYGFLSLTDFYLSALARGIDITGFEEDEICAQIKEQTPSFEWQRLMIAYYKSLPYSLLKNIEEYGSHGYVDMNKALRKDPYSPAPLNDLIDRAPSLDKDIIVWRFVFEFAGEEDSEYVINGYLSTTFEPLFAVIRKTCTNPKLFTVLRITIPKGTRCLLIAKEERELIFPHGSILNVGKKRKQRFVCQVSGATCNIEEINIIDCTMSTKRNISAPTSHVSLELSKAVPLAEFKIKDALLDSGLPISNVEMTFGIIEFDTFKDNAVDVAKKAITIINGLNLKTKYKDASKVISTKINMLPV